MALYKDVEGYRKLFDEEYKKTRKLISEGETHLDNLAEGFSEASRVIDCLPTADVAPKSEVERLQAEIENKQFRCDSCDRIGLTHSEHIYCIKQAKAAVAREIFAEIERYVIKGISVGGEHLTLFNGKNYDELKKKYTEEKE